MKSYKVTITETLQMTVDIEAPSRSEAERLVNKQWAKSDYVLDAGHFKGVTFRAQPLQKDRSFDR